MCGFQAFWFNVCTLFNLIGILLLAGGRWCSDALLRSVEGVTSLLFSLSLLPDVRWVIVSALLWSMVDGVTSLYRCLMYDEWFITISGKRDVAVLLPDVRWVVYYDQWKAWRHCTVVWCTVSALLCLTVYCGDVLFCWRSVFIQAITVLYTIGISMTRRF